MKANTAIQITIAPHAGCAARALPAAGLGPCGRPDGSTAAAGWPRAMRHGAGCAGSPSGPHGRQATHRAEALRPAPAGEGTDPHPHNTYRNLRQTQDRKSTRLNSSHLVISYAVFCLKKKKIY